MTQVKDIKPNNHFKELVLIISRVIQGVASNNTNYLNLLLQDKTGVISSRIWDASKEAVSNLKTGTVIKMDANSISYNNEIQLKINSWEIIENPASYYDSLLYRAPIDIKIAISEIKDTVTAFKNDKLKKILNYMLKENIKNFSTWPAAVKMHHAVQSGLLWHTITMLRMAKQVMTIYADRNINPDLLYAGIIMHDFGKLTELDNNPISSFTLAGKLLGHISIACDQIGTACKELNINPQEDIVILLQHLVLASHGKYEYGSPVLPKTLEAEILHHLDNLDAKIYAIDEALKNISIGDSTKSLPAVENRIFYKHFNDKSDK